MEALMREIQPEFLVWRSFTGPVPQAQGHLKHSPEKLVAGLSLCPESTKMGISSTLRARGDIPSVHGCKGISAGHAAAPRPGSWPVVSTEHSEGPRHGFRLHLLGL